MLVVCQDNAMVGWLDRLLEDFFSQHFEHARFPSMCMEWHSIGRKYVLGVGLFSKSCGWLVALHQQLQWRIITSTFDLVYCDLVQVIKNVTAMLWTVLPGNTDIYWRRVFKALYAGDPSEGKRVSFSSVCSCTSKWVKLPVKLEFRYATSFLHLVSYGLSELWKTA